MKHYLKLDKQHRITLPDEIKDAAMILLKTTEDPDTWVLKILARKEE